LKEPRLAVARTLLRSHIQVVRLQRVNQASKSSIEGSKKSTGGQSKELVLDLETVLWGRADNKQRALFDYSTRPANSS
jgi:hypothetical protein